MKAQAPRSVWRHVGRWSKRVAVSAVILSLAYILWTNYRGSSAKRRIAGEMTALNIPLYVDDSRPWDESVDTSSDGTHYYRAAFALRDYADRDDLPIVGMADAPGLAEPVPEELQIRLREAVKQNRLLFKLLNTGRIHKDFSYDMDFGLMSTNNDLDILGGIRNAARWTQLKCLEAQGRKDNDAAIDSCLLVLAMNDSLQDEQIPIVQLIRISVDALTFGMIEEALSRITVGEDDLPRLLEMMRALANRKSSVDLTNGQAEEITIAYEAMDNIRMYLASQAYSRKQVLRMIENDPDEEWKKTPFAGWMKTQFVDKYARSSSRIWAALCPGWYELELAEEIDQRLSDYRHLQSIGTNAHALHDFSEKKLPSGVGAGTRATARTWLQWKSRLDVARAALAVEVYRVKYGRWPESLHEILSEPPVDIYTEEPLRYAPFDDGVIIYSVGLNRIDEKGENSWNSDNYDADDMSFRLFNPELRGAKPTPETPEDDMDSDGYQGSYGPYPGR